MPGPCTPSLSMPSSSSYGPYQTIDDERYPPHGESQWAQPEFGMKLVSCLSVWLYPIIIPTCLTLGCGQGGTRLRTSKSFEQPSPLILITQTTLRPRLSIFRWPFCLLPFSRLFVTLSTHHPLCHLFFTAPSPSSHPSLSTPPIPPLLRILLRLAVLRNVAAISSEKDGHTISLAGLSSYADHCHLSNLPVSTPFTARFQSLMGFSYLGHHWFCVFDRIPGVCLGQANRQPRGMDG